jgi:hypothetical protein
VSAWTVDEQRSARLLFSPELAEGLVAEDEVLASPAVRAAVRDRGVPWLPRRAGQVVGRKLGRLDPYARHTAPAVAARRAVLGARAHGPPRVLLRMDEYPHWLAAREPDHYGDAAFAPWAEALAGHPHLIAVLPRLAADPMRAHGPSRDLTDTEVQRLGSLAADGVAFGLHGNEHRTRFADPRRRTELGERSPAEVGALLDDARERFRARTGLDTSVLVPPFNTFSARQWPALADRFAVVTGGPEAILRVGAAAPGTFRDGTVYLPAYEPLYGSAAEVLPALERHLEARTALWTPIVLHWGWEAAHGWRDLERLVARVAPYLSSWSDFADAVEKSR